MSDYSPELGQAIFGQPHKEHQVPEIMDAALMRIHREITRVLWNIMQDQFDPFIDGAAFRCAVFGVWAYDWGEGEQPYNFKHPSSGLEVSWYKHSWRGLSANMDISPDLAALVLDDCLAACQALEGSITDSGYRTRKRPMLVGSIEEVPYFDAPPRQPPE